MSKTPEQMAEEYASFAKQYVAESIRKQQMMANDKIAFLAGYKAAQDQLADAGKVMNSPDKPDGWISVKERLPEINEKVLVIFRNRIALAAIEEKEDEFTKQGKFTVWKCLKLHKDDIYECYPWNDITHWMPLHEAPKEEK